MRKPDTIRQWSAVAVAAMLAVPSPFAVAGEIADRAGEAEALLQQGKGAEALAAFDRATEAIWNAMPLQIRTAAFAGSIGGFGKYEPRPEGAFRSGDTATVYVEPAGYGFTGAGPAFTVALVIGIAVVTPGGLTLAKADDFGRIEWEGRSRSREIHTALAVTLPALKPGSYRLLLKVTDAATGKSASTELPFRIAGQVQ